NTPAGSITIHHDDHEDEKHQKSPLTPIALYYKVSAMESNWAAEHLQVIRTLMERSAIYRRGLAPIMIFHGGFWYGFLVVGWGLEKRRARGFLWVWGRGRGVGGRRLVPVGAASGTQRGRAILVASDSPRHSSYAPATYRGIDCGSHRLAARGIGSIKCRL